LDAGVDCGQIDRGGFGLGEEAARPAVEQLAEIGGGGFERGDGGRFNHGIH
jgi:hypothetical protein